jgi:glucose/arabinose dehydrogenase/uncharacterized cupredoxin-like copper-binding protein
MPRFRLALVAVLATLLGGTGALTASAQQATPTATAPPIADVAQPGGSLPGNPQIQLVQVASGLADPINVAAAPDGSGRLFIVERIGRVRILDQNGSLLPDPFLDIQTLVKTDFLEQGLLGLAFHPDYTSNGLFYVYYADYRTNGDAVLSEYRVSRDNPNVADPESARILLTVDDPYVNHNGGNVLFGPDGYLYWSMGDGGLAGDPYDNAQRIDNLLGKLLRIDVNTRDAGEYGIPQDNPWANTGKVLPSNQANQMAQDGSYHPDARRELCDWGLRNPWEFSFDTQTGDMYVPDVGQNSWEEVNFFPAGQLCGWNMGWDFNEGAHCYPPSDQACEKVGALPVAEYDHSRGDCSITGIGIYRGQESTSLDGIYFNSDYCSGTVYGLARDQNGAWQYAELLKTSLQVTGAGQDEAGELYLTACTCRFSRTYDPLENPGGTVWRIVQADMVPEGATTAPTPTPEGSPVASPEASATESPTVTSTSANGGQNPAASPGAGGGTVAQTEVTVEMVDIDFNPNEFTIPANTDVTITLPNNGAALHTFVISDHNNENVPNLGIKVEVQPGQTGTVTVNAPPGDYYFFCDVPGHEAAGMFGTMHVVQH